jgi:putative phosphoribosyl transferase
MLFDDRADAGRQLASRLLRYETEDPIVIGVPRGGVPVAYEIARALDAPLDVVVARKIGAPQQPELGLGAIVDGDHPEKVLNEDLVRMLHVPRTYIEREAATQLEEIHRRQALFRGGRPRVELAGRTVIVVDDGIATGGTVRAVLRGVQRARPRRVVLAVGVAPPDTAEMLRAEVDELVCIATPEPFHAVGQFFRDFSQVSDDEVVRVLAKAAERAPGARAGRDSHH